MWGCTELVGPFCLIPEVRGMKADLVLPSYGPPQGYLSLLYLLLQLVLLNQPGKCPTTPH
jgi:hypothetical protein